MKYLFILLLIFSSCESKRAANKIAWLKRNGYSFVDTLKIKGETKQGEIIIQLDSNKLDSIAGVIAEEYQRLLDSCSNSKDSNNARKSDNLVKSHKEKFKGLIRQIPCNIEPINDSTNRFSLKVWSDSGRLKYDLKIKDIDVGVECPKCLECEKWHWTILEIIGLGFLCFVGGGITILIIKR